MHNQFNEYSWTAQVHDIPERRGCLVAVALSAALVLSGAWALAWRLFA